MIAPMVTLPDLDGDVQPELEQELAVQADGLAQKVSQTRERLEFLRQLVARVEDQLEVDEALLRQLEGLLGRGRQLPLETLNARLRGARLREVAIEVLRCRARDEPV